MRAIHQQQATTWPIHYLILDQAEILLRVLQQLLLGGVAEFLSDGGKKRPGVLVVLGFEKPCPREEVVRAGALAYGACETWGMGMGGADGVVAARGEAPGYDFAHVEDALFLHPIMRDCLVWAMRV